MQTPVRTQLSYLLVTLAVAGSACGSDGDDRSCEPGSAACACLEDDACGDGLACEDGVCRGESDVGISVSDGRARACDLLLAEGAGHVHAVAFGDAVKGTFVREAPRVAVSLISASDAPIPADAVSLRVVGDAADVEVADVACADSAGEPLANVTIGLAKN